MSDEQRRDDEGEVDAHRRRFAGNEEPGSESETDDDVEAHRFKKDVMRKD